MLNFVKCTLACLSKSVILNWAKWTCRVMYSCTCQSWMRSDRRHVLMFQTGYVVVLANRTSRVRCWLICIHWGCHCQCMWWHLSLGGHTLDNTSVNLDYLMPDKVREKLTVDTVSKVLDLSDSVPVDPSKWRHLCGATDAYLWVVIDDLDEITENRRN